MTQLSPTCQLRTTTYYADRKDEHTVDKPYELRFSPPKDFPATNITFSSHDNVKVEDIRGREHAFQAQSCGFQLCELRTSLTYEDFANHTKVEQIYLDEAASCLKRVLGAARVLVFDHNVSDFNLLLHHTDTRIMQDPQKSRAISSIEWGARLI